MVIRTEDVTSANWHKFADIHLFDRAVLHQYGVSQVILIDIANITIILAYGSIWIHEV